MEAIISYFASLGMDFQSILRLGGILLIGALILSGVCRFIFRKTNMISQAVSSSIAVIFIYVVMVLILTVIPKLRFLVTPLPFVTFTQDILSFFSFRSGAYPSIAAEILSMIILAFLVNLADGWMPRRKHLLKWLFWKCLTVVVGFLLHYLAVWLFNRYLPQVIVLYAPAILLAILVVMLLTGALKLVVGLLLATVNPVIGALYTFFFANVVGKQITKAILTTGILSGVIVLLEDMGITVLSLQPGALVAYIPFLLLLIPVWYAVSRQ